MSSVYTASTSYLSLPAEPRYLQVLNETGGSIALGWQPPLDEGGSEVTKYVIYFFAGFEMKQQFSQMVYSVNKAATSVTAKVTGLTTNTAYGFVVAAVNEITACVDFSSYADYAVTYGATTSVTTPDTPRRFSIAISTTGMQMLTWFASEDTGGGGFVGYIVYSDGWSVLYNGSATAFERGGLARNTTYGYRVVAWNSAGSSAASSMVSASTTGTFTVPGVPTNLEVISATGGSIELQWGAPVDTGGDVLSRYQIFRNGTLVSLADSGSAVMTFLDTLNLYAEQVYTYYIRATNSMGVGQPSVLLPARTTSASRPSPPTELNVSASGSKLASSWTPSGNSGGIALSGFRIRITAGASVIVETMTTVTNYTYYGIQERQEYSVSVVAVNSIDESLPLQKDVMNGNATRPGTPSTPAVVSTGSQSVILQLSVPHDAGGSPITELRLYQDDVLRQVVQTNRLIQVEVSGLLSRKSYRFRSSAVSLPLLGESDLSDGVIVVTGNPTEPSVVYNAALNGRSSSSLEVKWAGPDNTGGEDVSYEVVFAMDGTDTYTSVFSTRPNIVIEGLNASTTYLFQIRAQNSAGAGPWMSEPLVANTDVAQRGVVVFETPYLLVDEDIGMAVINLVRVNGSSSAILCNYALLNTSNATETADFVLAAQENRSFEFLDGETTKSFEIAIVDNSVYDPFPRLVNIVLTDTTDRSDIIEPQTLVVAITDDGDAGTFAFESVYSSIPENGGCLNLLISRTNGASTETTVRVIPVTNYLSTARENVDFQLFTPDIVFPDQTTAANVTVCALNNNVFDFPFLSFQLALRVIAGGGEVGAANVTHVMIEDDGDRSPPGRVRLVTAAKATGGLLRIDWLPPTNLGAQTSWILQYNVSLSSSNSSDVRIITTRDNTTEVSVGGLAALTNYSVRIAAINSVGSGLFSAATNHSTTNVTAPGPVSEVSLIKRTGGLLTVNITAPMDDGGLMITRYEVVVSHNPDASNEVRLLLVLVSAYCLVHDD